MSQLVTVSYLNQYNEFVSTLINGTEHKKFKKNINTYKNTQAQNERIDNILKASELAGDANLGLINLLSGGLNKTERMAVRGSYKSVLALLNIMNHARKAKQNGASNAQAFGAGIWNTGVDIALDLPRGYLALIDLLPERERKRTIESQEKMIEKNERYMSECPVWFKSVLREDNQKFAASAAILDQPDKIKELKENVLYTGNSHEENQTKLRK